MVEPKINIQITSNIPIIISPNGLEYVSDKNFTLRELDRIQEICKNHSADHYMLTPEAIDKLGIKIDGSTVEAYTPPTQQDI